MEMDIDRAQQLLREHDIDGWLIYNFKGSNDIADRILNLPDTLLWSRRYFYFVPAEGIPRKLVHRIEQNNLDSLPGDKTVYLSWQSLGDGLKEITGGAHRIAMEFSPHNAIPYVSRIDAGTVDLMRFLGKDIVSSANIIQEFEAALTDEQIESHMKAAKLIRQCMHNAFDEIRKRLKKAGDIKEYTIQQFLVKRFKEHNLTCHHAPLVAVNEHAGNPHYLPNAKKSGIIRENDLVLIDEIGKLQHPGSIYADITWMGYTGDTVPDEYAKPFAVAAKARDAGVNFLEDKFRNNIAVRGFEVDDVVRGIIRDAGYGDKFIHRTGHSIGEEVHANGANIDNLETHDDRRIIPRTCFSIEPGIYTNEFGIRTEIDVMIMPDGEVAVTGGEPQKEIVKI